MQARTGPEIVRRQELLADGKPTARVVVEPAWQACMGLARHAGRRPNTARCVAFGEPPSPRRHARGLFGPARRRRAARDSDPITRKDGRRRGTALDAPATGALERPPSRLGVVPPLPGRPSPLVAAGRASSCGPIGSSHLVHNCLSAERALQALLGSARADPRTLEMDNLFTTLN